MSGRNELLAALLGLSPQEEPLFDDNGNSKMAGRSPESGCAGYCDKILGKLGDVNFLCALTVLVSGTTMSLILVTT